MVVNTKSASRQLLGLLLTAGFVVLLALPVIAGEYDHALDGVRNYDAVYEVSQGDPKVANVVFWAIKNSYEDAAVKNLPHPPNIVIVFHGPAVKLISSDMGPFNKSEQAEVKKFQQTLRQMKKDGVTMEVCLYAAKVLGVDKATIIPEVDQVGNGFVSVIGYQMQGYAVVRLP